MCVRVCVKAREENEMRKKHLTELQMQVNSLQTAGSQMKTKASDLTSAIVSINVTDLKTERFCRLVSLHARWLFTVFIFHW